MDAQTQREYPGAKPNEVATLVVNGMYFSAPPSSVMNSRRFTANGSRASTER